MGLDVLRFGGIYMPSLLAFLALTAALCLLLRRGLRRLQAHRLFWHPALAGAGLFIAILAALILLFGP